MPRYTLPEGYEVHISHFRRFQVPETGTTYNADIPLDPKDKLLPHGGVTVADITDSHGCAIASGEAYCGPKDNYSKKLGRNIATGRALKNVALNFEIS